MEDDPDELTRDLITTDTLKSGGGKKIKKCNSLQNIRNESKNIKGQNNEHLCSEHDQVLNVMEDIVTPKLEKILNHLIYEIYIDMNEAITPSSTFYQSMITNSQQSLFDETFDTDLASLPEEFKDIRSLKLCMSWTQLFTGIGIFSVNIIHFYFAILRNMKK